MPVVYHCPHCRQPITVPDQMLGQVIGCPHCRGALQTFPPQLPVVVPAADPPQPSPAEVFSLDDVERTDDEDDTPRRRRYQPAARRGREPAKVTLPAQLATICAVIGSVIVVVVFQNRPRAAQGFDFKQVAISAVVGGVCAGLGFLIGKLIEGGKADKGNTRRRARSDEDEDDE